MIVADLGGDGAQHPAFLGEKITRLEVAMTRECADREVVARVADVRQVTDPADIDKNRRRREPQLHEW